MRRSGEGQRVAAVVNLPDEITRGWEWGWSVIGAAALSGVGWLHFALGVQIPIGRSGRYAPDWFLILVLALGLVWIAYGACARIFQKRRATAWMREVGNAGCELDAGGVARVVAEYLGLDAEAFGSISYATLARAERTSGQPLPWMWLDSRARTLLMTAPQTAKFRFDTKRPRDRWLPTFAVVMGAIGIICLFAVMGSTVYGVKPTDVIIAAVPAAVAIIVGVACAWPRAPELVFIQDRAILMRGGREVAAVGPENAFVAVVRRRYSAKTGHGLLDSVRWWFYVPGQRAVWIDDLCPKSTPWGEQILAAIANTQPSGEWVGACPVCGYPTAGLTTSVCPECGKRLGGA
jgi:hypothetical protein